MDKKLGEEPVKRSWKYNNQNNFAKPKQWRPSTSTWWWPLVENQDLCWKPLWKFRREGRVSASPRFHSKGSAWQEGSWSSPPMVVAAPTQAKGWRWRTWRRGIKNKKMKWRRRNAKREEEKTWVHEDGGGSDKLIIVNIVIFSTFYYIQCCFIYYHLTTWWCVHLNHIFTVWPVLDNSWIIVSCLLVHDGSLPFMNNFLVWIFNHLVFHLSWLLRVAFVLVVLFSSWCAAAPWVSCCCWAVLTQPWPPIWTRWFLWGFFVFSFVFVPLWRNKDFF